MGWQGKSNSHTDRDSKASFNTKGNYANTYTGPTPITTPFTAEELAECFNDEESPLCRLNFTLLRDNHVPPQDDASLEMADRMDNLLAFVENHEMDGTGKDAEEKACKDFQYGAKR